MNNIPRVPRAQLLDKLISIIFYVILFILVCILLSRKTDYHVDEISTYVLSNADHWFSPDNQVTFSPASQPFVDIMSSNGTFDLGHVWQQQSNDTHPPVYYALVHGICTLFPGTVSVWYAGAINILFILLTLYVYQKIVRLLTGSRLVTHLLCAVFVFSAGILSISTFLRMYVMTIFWITLFSYLLLRHMTSIRAKDYLLFGTIAALGALTHYYFIVYAFFISVVFVLLYAIRRQFKECLLYILTMGIAGGLSCLIYPAMIRQIFLTGRGAESLDNMSSRSLPEQVKIYFAILDDNTFGGMLLYILVGILFLYLANFILGRFCTSCRSRYRCCTSSLDNDTESPSGHSCECASECSCECSPEYSSEYRKGFILLAVPTFFYFLIIAKSAVYNSDRYISPIFVVTIAVVLSLLYVQMRRFAMYIMKLRPSASDLRALPLVVLLLITCSSNWLCYTKCPWKYLYLDSRERLSYAAQQGPVSDALIIYGTGWKVDPHYLEISECKTATFYQADSYEAFSSQVSDSCLGDNLVLFVMEIDSASFLQEFLEARPEYTLLRDNGHWGYGQSYYLTRTDSLSPEM